MGRCQHCKKLTHSEDLIVYYDVADHDKVFELTRLKDWIPAFQYFQFDKNLVPSEYGKLKCGDIYIHFRVKNGMD